ncbi:protein NRT1/ PTR FAMILY 2.6-like isoform X7 [Diospyros lotus]|nr:protein NRT1/ PTR FAMILY 2.6-like isoform X2 [Diospyros lotus]XP_052170960.1 protein NRT1/ PTR FAMILY 2.6-like isoform X4 [Diospyros lotus]XP_052170966.1 protein NRT1/ PTR FAMILY 2.6-like isoform X5 [Diospyros lotus]XP_052170973.1 protein NRT1/ PTR FAMILY 2.6-like isoform X5 [Diospyros lotus]XP_052170992.1 protein NRT1/ PTR FAMILY 2.6-like isoform X7 [Diospyros lotus]
MEPPEMIGSKVSGGQRGGWMSCLFIAASMIGFQLAAGGWMSNLIVYLTEEFNVKSIGAAQISSNISSWAFLAPVIGAILADSLFSCFSVILICSIVSLLGIILLFLTATIGSLKPTHCEIGWISCNNNTPSGIQFAVLYAGIALGAIGFGGLNSIIASFGAAQLENVNDRGSFFSWYFFILCSSSVISGTAIVYVEDNVSWAWGFGICVAANLVGIVIFLSRTQFYHQIRPRGSPFSRLAQVTVASIHKRKIILSSKSEDYYHGQDDDAANLLPSIPSPEFGFFNRAAIITEGDIKFDGSKAKPWSLSTVQEVEDLKTLIKIFPVWSTGILLSIPIAVQAGLMILQVLTMDRHLGPNFEIPAGSFTVVSFLSITIFLPVVNKFISPTWKKLTRRHPTSLQRIGAGHLLTVVSMAVSAMVESKRLNVAYSLHPPDKPASTTVPMSALWLLPQVALAGCGPAFHFPGHVEFYYQEFPASLKSTATAMNSVTIATAYYLSSGVLDVLKKNTPWLPDDVNSGRLDLVFWIFGGVVALNYCYFLGCSMSYRYRNLEQKDGSLEAEQN